MARFNRTFRLIVRKIVLRALLPACPLLVSAAGVNDLSWEIDLESRFAGDAPIHGGNAQGSFEEWMTDLRCALSPQISPNLLLRFGVEWQRFAFDAPTQAAVPSTLQKLHAILGLDYQLTDHWLVRAELQPGIYSDFQNIGWDDVNAPLLLSAAYLANADLQWLVGLRIDARCRYPVLPAAGVRWRFADEWTLNFQFPNPRLEWNLNDRFQAYLGGGIELGTFALGNHYGDDHGQPELNRAIVDYSEIRVGPGFSWKLAPRFTVEAEAGYTVYRRLDFFDEHVLLRGDPAPYVQLVGHIRF